jgi:hypothetical protein
MASLKLMLRMGLANLFKDRDLMNDINVFPVADGDTGDNLCNTFLPLYGAMDGIADGTPAGILRELHILLLPNARGNSGIIFSQYLYTFIRALRECPELTTAALADAMAEAVREAYACVQVPREGTILTLMRETAEGFRDGAEEGLEVIPAFQKVRARAREALEHTPDHLPVLKKAGVVDSGAMGFYLFFEGMAKGLTHEALEEHALEAFHKVVERTAPSDQPAYCALWLVDPRGRVKRDFFDLIRAHGDSIAISDDGDAYNIHIHTTRPEHVRRALEAHGAILRHKVEPLFRRRGGTGLVVDSACDLPEGAEEDFGILTVPFLVFVDGVEHRDRVDLPKTEFYEKLADLSVSMSTSQPPPAAYLEAYRRGLELYDDLVVLTLSSRLSGSHGSAVNAVRLLPEEQRARVTVVDSRTLSTGLGLLALLAQDAVEEGLPTDAIRQRVEAARDRLVSLGYLHSVDRAVKGGRVPPTLGRLVRWLGIKPLVTFDGGIFGKRGALLSGGDRERKLAARFVKALDPSKPWAVGIAYTDNPGAAERVEAELRRSSLRMTRCYRVAASPVLGAHAGCGTFCLWALPE